MARIITITSGKGGVGKTSISLNLALSLAAKGLKVCLFDADLGLANVNVLTGIYPTRDLEAVIDGECGISDILIRDYHGIDIIPGSSGVEKIADLTKDQTSSLIKSFLEIEAYDYFIFDTSAGISKQVISFCLACKEIFLVVTREPTSLTDAYSLLKVLSRYKYQRTVNVLFNHVISAKAIKKAYTQLEKTVDRYLSMRLRPLGIVISDKKVQSAVVAQTPFLIKSPETAASKCINTIANKVIKRSAAINDMPIEQFWNGCLSFLDKHQEKKKPVPSEHSEKPVKKHAPEALNGERLEKVESLLSNLVDEIRSLKDIYSEQAGVQKEMMESLKKGNQILMDAGISGQKGNGNGKLKKIPGQPQYKEAIAINRPRKPVKKLTII